MVKPLARGISILLLSLLLLVGGVGLWLQQDVRTFSWAKPWLTKALNPPDAPYKISIGDVAIDWRHPSRLGRIRINGMVVTLLDGTAFVSVPQVAVSVDPLGFLPYHHALKTITLLSPKLYLTRTEGGALRMGLEEQGQSLPLAELAGFFAGESTGKKSSMDLPFRAVAVEKAALTIKDETTGAAVLVSKPFTLRLAKGNLGGLHATLAMPFTYNGRQGRVDARLSGSLTSSDQVLALSLSKFPVELACQFGACTADISGAGIVSGKAQLLLDRHGIPVGGRAALQAQNATLVAPTFFPEPLKLKNGTVSAHLVDRGNNFLIQRAQLAFEDTTLDIRMQILRRGEKWRLLMEGEGERLDVVKLYKYWPLVLAPSSRDWVTSKLKGGHSANATLSLDITSDMYDANKFPEEAVNATVIARDITVEYLPGFPEVRHANGVARFVGDTLRIHVTSGSLLSGTKVTSGTLTADDLHHPRAPMVARLKLDAPAADVAAMFKLEHFPFDNAWKLDPATIKGRADISMKLGFDSFSEDESSGINFDHVKYNITAELQDIAQPKVMGSTDVRNLSGTLHVSDTALSFDGRLGVSAATGLNISLKQDAAGHVSADVSGSLPRSEFAVLGIPDKPWFGQGNLGMNAHVELGKETVRPTRATLDLTDLAMEIPELSWSKKRGEQGSLTINAGKEANSYSASLVARDLEARDIAISTDAAGELTAVKIPRVKTAANDFSLDYATTKDGYTVNLTGARLDASVSYGKSENSLLANFPPITLNVNLGEMVLVPNQPLTDLKGNLTCNVVRCEKASISAKAGKGLLQAGIGTAPAGKANKAPKREFVLTASDAGELLKALDITDRLYDGKLELTGKYDDTKQPAPFNGRLIINDFSLKNSQILGRIVSLASITGVGDALTGTTSFSKLGADIHHLNGIVNVQNGKASGAALGITLEGKVDTTTTRLNMKGVLVPANIINSLFTKIPIIGKLAGKEGEGLIAFNYKIDGTYSDPDVSVNPLSGLTPGFLRGVFGGGTSSSTDKKGSAPAPYPGDRPAPTVPEAATKKTTAPAKD